MSHTHQRQRTGTGSQPGGGKSGQAIVEFVVGLVAILVVFAVMLQIGLLAFEHTQVLTEARREAGDYALRDSYNLLLPGPRFIRDWEPGPDGRTYSRDDVPIQGGSGIMSAHILLHAHPGSLNREVPGNPVSTMANAALPINEFGLVQGRAESDPVDILPAVQHLIYDAEEITLEKSSWMVWTRGIY